MKPKSTFYETGVEIEIEDAIVDAVVSMREDGTLAVDIEGSETLSEPPDNISMEPVPTKTYNKVSGHTLDGNNITLDGLVVSFSVGQNWSVSSVLTLRQATIFDSNDSAIVDEEVTIEVDVTNFKPFIPLMNAAEKYPLITRSDWEISGIPLSDIEERIDLIQARRVPLRTAKMEITQEVNGPPDRQVRKAWKRVTRVLELSSFVQGIGHSPVRLSVSKVDGSDWGNTYTRLVSTATNLGGLFKSENLVWGDLSAFIDEAYDPYVTSNRDDIRLNNIINQYLDAINSTRPIEGRFSTLCSAIELMAKRHSDLGPGHNGTEEMIKYLIDKLKVNTKDLARSSGSFPNRHLPKNSSDQEGWSHRYFYFRARQYVAHGENLKEFEDDNSKFTRDYFATLALLQRLLRNQLLPTQNIDNYHKLENVEPKMFNQI